MLRYGPCVTRRSHSFNCHPHANHTCLYSPAARHHRPLAGPTHEGWPDWVDLGGLVTYQDKCPALGIAPRHGYPPQY